jgi:hypothetical protein
MRQEVWTGEFVTQAIDGDGFDASGIALSTGLGAVGGLVPDPFRQVGLRPYRMYNIWRPGKNAFRQYGNAFVEGGITAAMMTLVNRWQGAANGRCEPRGWVWRWSPLWWLVERSTTGV